MILSEDTKMKSTCKQGGGMMAFHIYHMINISKKYLHRYNVIKGENGKKIGCMILLEEIVQSSYFLS